MNKNDKFIANTNVTQSLFSFFNTLNESGASYDSGLIDFPLLTYMSSPQKI